VGKFYPNFPG